VLLWYIRKKGLKMDNVKTKKLVVCALLASICFVVTRFLSVPALYTKGYVNLGDVVVLLCAFVMGGWHGALAAAIGASMADASMGYWVYSPATFVIKGAMVILASFFFKKSYGKSKAISLFMIACACVLAEVLMVLGYFLFESFLYKSFAVAFASLAGSVIQAITCIIPSLMLILFFKNNSSLFSFIKSLNK